MVLRTGKGSPSTMAQSCSQAKSWVKTHYERYEPGVVAKSVMYKHYEDCCRELSRNLMETSIFGRVVKNVFPDVTIRRLGGRDNLKYYYCGIHAKETSPYVIDNDTTTKPKRRLRKRELVTDKAEVTNCLRWLHAHFSISNESSVVKTEVYETYVGHCKARVVEPLSAQYFGMVVIHAFPNVTKRKLGPRTNQQKYYFGIQERLTPMSLGSYREVINGDEDEEEDYSCRSPESDMSDPVAHNFAPEVRDMRASPYAFDRFIKIEKENQPVDYSLATLKLKDEPTEDDDIMIKVEVLEPLNLHINRDICERRTPDRPPSAGNFVSSTSPSPPAKDNRSRKIYKPRFHYESYCAEDKRELSSVHFYEEREADTTLKNWMRDNMEESKGVHIDRDQLFAYYEKYCAIHTKTSLPMTYFDETMLKEFDGVVTMIHPSTKTFYEGIRVKSISLFYGKIQEFADESPWAEEEESSPHAMELSPEDESHSSPLPLEDEDDPSDEGYSYHEKQIEEDMQSTPEVLRDGKFYLRKWLTDHFDDVPNSCVLKSDAYSHYHAFAYSINQVPFEMNVFGKIVRVVFPKVSIRRLGGRIKPQYHYCGIAVKKTSHLYQVMSGKDPAQRSRKKEIATDNRTAEIVIDFLRQNYDEGKDRSTTKSEVFERYISLCNSINESPVTLNYFGKLVKYCFPNVEARKFGGKNDPTWYYFGMFLKEAISYNRYHNSLTQISSSPSFHDDSTMKEAIGASFCDPTRLSPAIMDIRHHSTSPIPISMNRLSNMPNHYIGSSPPALLNARLITSSSRNYEEATHQGNSPLDSGTYYRESISSPATEVYYSRSPVENHVQGQLYPTNHLEYPREMYNHSHRMIHLTGGQVVPSQTPPDHSMGLLVGTKPKRNFVILEGYEDHDIGME